MFYIINFVYRRIKDVMSPHPTSFCLYKSLAKGINIIDIFGTNRTTTHPCALAKITVLYLLSTVEQTNIKGLVYLNDVLVLVNWANITLFDVFKKLKLVCKSIEFPKQCSSCLIYDYI